MVYASASTPETYEYVPQIALYPDGKPTLEIWFKNQVCTEVVPI